MRVVLDTNVIVSGLPNPSGAPGRVLDLLLAGHLSTLYDDRVLTEYRDVVARPRLGIDQGMAGVVPDHLVRTGELVVAPPLAIQLPDASDRPFVEVAAAGAAYALVTGSGRHFAAARFILATPILTPAQFLDLWRTR